MVRIIALACTIYCGAIFGIFTNRILTNNYPTVKIKEQSVDQVFKQFLKLEADFTRQYGKSPTSVYVGTETVKTLTSNGEAKSMFRTTLSGQETFNGLDVLIIQNRTNYLKLGL